jgi:hypothetical protein
VLLTVVGLSANEIERVSPVPVLGGMNVRGGREADPAADFSLRNSLPLVSDLKALNPSMQYRGSDVITIGAPTLDRPD